MGYGKLPHLHKQAPFGLLAMSTFVKIRDDDKQIRRLYKWHLLSCIEIFMATLWQLSTTQNVVKI